MIITFKSFLIVSIFFIKLSIKSIFTDLSCASSIIINSYFLYSESDLNSAKRIPSVTTLTRFSFLILFSNLVLNPTNISPFSSSVEIFSLIALAATLLGCVIKIFLLKP